MNRRRWMVSIAAMGSMLGSLVLPAAAGIVVVDAANGPGTDFTSLSPALNALAATGGTILMRSGTYVGPHVVVLGANAGELVIVADSGATVRLTAALPAEPKCALSIAAAAGSTPRRVILRGLTLQQTDHGGLVDNLVSGVALAVGCETDGDPVDVFIDECTATETIGTAAAVSYGRHVVVSHCTFVGGKPVMAYKLDGSELAYTFPGAGLWCYSTKPQHTAWVYSSWLEGGQGAPVHFKVGQTQAARDGGTGYFAWQDVAASTVPWGIVGCDVRGGVGGDGGLSLGGTCFLSADGGPGLDSWTKTQVYSVASTYDGGDAGPPGASPSCAMIVGDPGLDVAHGYSSFSGFHTDLPGSPGRALAPRTLREGETKSIGVEGPVGDAAFLFVGIQMTAVYANAISGALVVDPLLLLPVGTIGPSGTVTIPATLPNLGSGIDGFPLLLQAFTAEAGTGYIRAGAPSVTMLLDSQF